MTRSKSLINDNISIVIWRLVLPMIFGVIAVLSVSLIDTYFVGKLGSNALAAISFTFAVTFTISSLSIGLSAGAGSMVSRVIGEGNKHKARQLSTDAIILSLCLVIIISILGYIYARNLFSLLGARGQILDMIVRYMDIWFISMPFLVVPMVANAIIRAAGDAFWPSIIMIGAALVNIITTPMFVFGFGPIPQLGIEGAAWGTFIARVTTLIFALYILTLREKLLSYEIQKIRILLTSWWKILKIGIPASLGNATNPLGITIVTAIIATIGADTVAAFGVATRLEAFASIPMLALSSAIGPIAGQNWGANKKDRVILALKQCYIICFLWSAFIAIIFYFLGESFAKFLSSDADVAKEAAVYLKIVPFTLWGYGFIIVAAGAYNALGKSVTGLSFYLTRTALFYVPLSWFASILAGSEAIFIAISISNVTAGILIGAYSLWWLKQNQ